MSSSVSAQRRAGLARRHRRVRNKVAGSAERPRLVVVRSARHIYAQVVDDDRGHTLTSASTLDTALRGEAEQGAGDKTARAAAVGRLVAERAQSLGVSAVVFDRGGRRYHGRIAALADAAREQGLRF
jgi:large subunit ribosomal protein L18